MPSWSFGEAYTFNASRIHMLSLREKLLCTELPERSMSTQAVAGNVSRLVLGYLSPLGMPAPYARRGNRTPLVVIDCDVLKLSHGEKPMPQRDALIYLFPTQQYSYHTQLGVALPSAMSSEGALSTAGFGGSGWRSDCTDARRRGAELTVSLRGRVWQGQTNLRAVHEHQHGSGLPAQREGTEAALDKMTGWRVTLGPCA
jgi:hypothetical protein